MVRSSAVAFKLPSASRRESSWVRYSVCNDSHCVVRDVTVAVIGLEQLPADLELVRLVQRRADLLVDLCLARDVEESLFDMCT
eukprot:2231462-Pleurochrysis_carterae.AAC.4